MRKINYEFTTEVGYLENSDEWEEYGEEYEFYVDTDKEQDAIAHILAREYDIPFQTAHRMVVNFDLNDTDWFDEDLYYWFEDTARQEYLDWKKEK